MKGNAAKKDTELQQKDAGLRQKVYKEIGAGLAKTRKEKKLSIDDAVESTRIRAAYIKEIEAGNIDKLPGNMYTRAYVKSYADFLGEPSGEIMRLFDHAGQHDEVEEEKKEVKEEVKQRPEEFDDMMKPGTVIVIISAIAVLITYGIWYMIQKEEPAPAVSEITSSADVTEEPVSRAERVVDIMSKEDHAVIIVANKNTVVSILDEGGSLVEESIMQPGDTFFLPEGEELIMKVKDLSTIDVFVDGETVASLDGLERKEGGLVLDKTKLLAAIKIEE